ncbi:MAG: diguanylate cyclase [Deltaproteobacteria bacterium]|nr:diguanylate cyclase [Deltaproteobacteria bacterium]
MESLRSAIIKTLQHSPGGIDQIDQQVILLAKKHGLEAYSMALHILTHLEIEKNQAQRLWGEIINHHQTLMSSLKRDVSFSTTICDYFCSINKAIRNPKIVEIHIFEDKETAAKLDRLTGLYNRSYFDAVLPKELSRAKRYKQELSLIFFDLDDFKKINDSFGHLIGDEVLKNVSRIITQTIRASDIACRYGGEELLVILPQTGRYPALILAERIREKVENMDFYYENHQIKITISGGLATYPVDSDDSDTLLNNADKALYAAKSIGKNEVVVYSDDNRKHLRVTFDREISLNQGEPDQENSLSVKSKNLSKLGILLESENSLEVGKTVGLQLEIDPSDQPISLLGTVVRVESSSSSLYNIGISFLDVDPRIKNELSRYLLKKLTLDQNENKQNDSTQ